MRAPSPTRKIERDGRTSEEPLKRRTYLTAFRRVWGRSVAPPKDAPLGSVTKLGFVDAITGGVASWRNALTALTVGRIEGAR